MARDNKVVKEILFNVKYKGKTYKDLDLGYHGEKENRDVTYGYIHDEDGPWGMVDVGDDVIDFQIFGDYDTHRLKMDAMMMYWDEEEKCYCHGDYIEDIKISNIRVKYED